MSGIVKIVATDKDEAALLLEAVHMLRVQRVLRKISPFDDERFPKQNWEVEVLVKWECKLSGGRYIPPLPRRPL